MQTDMPGFSNTRLKTKEEQKWPYDQTMALIRIALPSQLNPRPYPTRSQP